MKVYKITCPKCEETREVCAGQYSLIVNGKRPSNCRECSIINGSKEYKVVCPLCNCERLVNPPVYYAVKHGRAKGLCEECTEAYRKSSEKQEIMTPQYLINAPYLGDLKEKQNLNRYTYQSNHRDELNKRKQEYRKNNKEHDKYLRRLEYLKRRAFTNISKELLNQIIEVYTINGMIFCYICRSECSDNYHIDHVIPIVKGGRNNKENLKPSCPTCNLRKNDKDLEEFLNDNPYLKSLYLKEA